MLRLWAALLAAAPALAASPSSAEGSCAGGSDEFPATYKSKDYRGCQNKTVSGKTCQKWSAHSPHEHPLDNTPESKGNLGIGDHNYCRNPDDEGTIWCYTTDPETRWEYCQPLVRCGAVECGVPVEQLQCRWPYCHAAECGSIAKADGTPCDDGKPNTRNEQCVEGVCKGDDLCRGVECPAPTVPCRGEPRCELGLCAEPFAPDGTRCDDGNPETLDDMCDYGMCIGYVPCGWHNCSTWTPLCAVPHCDTAAEICTETPLPDGTRCDDGVASTSNDRCSAGECRGTCGGRDDGCVGRLAALGLGDGDCDEDIDCESGLVCGHQNCGNFRDNHGWPSGNEFGWDLTDDCCEYAGSGSKDAFNQAPGDHPACALVSCASQCGRVRPSADDLCECACDQGCLEEGDCCKDYVDACANATGNASAGACSCKGRCGDTFVAPCGCSCDESCYDFGECCDDFDSACWGTGPAAGSPGKWWDPVDERQTCSCEGQCGREHSSCACYCDAVCRRCAESPGNEGWLEAGCEDCCIAPGKDASAVCPIAEADLSNCTCSGWCGDVAACGHCMCDDACTARGDCCPGWADDCPPAVPTGCTCAGSCGRVATCGTCACDATCRESGDCCADFDQACPGGGTAAANAPPPPAPTTPRQPRRRLSRRQPAPQSPWAVIAMALPIAAAAGLLWFCLRSRRR
eukprot:TRINITY_DN49899_c0_g1_i1.p1 TRINITY_DN49899_c0_g1~~TRINITY_DN49899_c0_g1_i1.p1  ORF type:complete len:714 (+),score=211.03 TRINITY_DN49899_c0_g1_i1:87-2144(+)